MTSLKKRIIDDGLTQRKFVTSDVVGKLLAGKAKLLWESIQYWEQYTSKLEPKNSETVNHRWKPKRESGLCEKKWKKKITNLFRSPRWSWEITKEEKKYILQKPTKLGFHLHMEETKMQLVVESICDNNTKKEKF